MLYVPFRANETKDLMSYYSDNFGNRAINFGPKSY